MLTGPPPKFHGTRDILARRCLPRVLIHRSILPVRANLEANAANV